MLIPNKNKEYNFYLIDSQVISYKKYNFVFFCNILFCQRTLYRVYFLSEIGVYCVIKLFLSDEKISTKPKFSRLQSGRYNIQLLYRFNLIISAS